MSSKPRLRHLAAVGAAALAAVALSGCSLISNFTGSNSTAARDAGTGEVVEGGQQSAFSMRVGDCWNDPEGTTVSELETVPCTDAHDNEVFALFDLPDGDFPGSDEVESAADAGCEERFADYIGTSYDASDLVIWPLWPTEGSWDGMGDREVVCSVYDPAGQLTGSVQGSGR